MPTNPVRAIICDASHKTLVVIVRRNLDERRYENPFPTSRNRIGQLTSDIEPEVQDKTFTYHIPQQYGYNADLNLATV